MATKNRLPALFGTVVRPLQAFFRLEAASGVLLFAAAVAALVWANSVAAGSYRELLRTPFVLGLGDLAARFTLLELVNDGLMTLFFFVVGMEIKRELVRGELKTPARAMLPAVAAVGGMVLPAAIFLAFNPSGPARAGWAIPMATDIAFSIGCLTLLKKRVPYALVVFLTALAIFDDIGGILVIAVFYGHGLHASWLLGAGGLIVLLAIMNSLHVTRGLAYLLLGGLLWYALHHGGVHATLAGVVLGLGIPARARRPPLDVLRALDAHVSALVERKAAANTGLEEAELLMIESKIEDAEAPLDRFVHMLHPYVAFVVMPVFALANAGVSLGGGEAVDVTGPVALGSGLGLFFGKMVGIFALTWMVVRLGWAPLPVGGTYTKLLGISIVAGIGFTVALFIATLAYASHPALLAEAKVGILVGSLVAGVVGSLVLAFTPVAVVAAPRPAPDVPSPAAG